MLLNPFQDFVWLKNGPKKLCFSDNWSLFTVLWEPFLAQGMFFEQNKCLEDRVHLQIKTADNHHLDIHTWRSQHQGHHVNGTCQCHVKGGLFISNCHCSELHRYGAGRLPAATLDIHSPGMSHFCTKLCIIHDHTSLSSSKCLSVNLISMSISGFSKWRLGGEGVSSTWGKTVQKVCQ